VYIVHTTSTHTHTPYPQNMVTLEEYVSEYIPHTLRPFFSQIPHIIKGISLFLEKENTETEVTPPIELIFSSLHLISFDPKGFLPNTLRVVFVLQDPYPQSGYAHGVAMSVRDGSIPMSLRNVEKVLKKSYPTFSLVNGDIRGWCCQGVLLWNTTLTTRVGVSRSHVCEWRDFNDLFIKYISTTFDFLVFVLFGSDARRLKGLIDVTKHVIIETSHPVARHPHNTFLDTNIFEDINCALVENRYDPIQWDDIHYY